MPDAQLTFPQRLRVMATMGTAVELSPDTARELAHHMENLVDPGKNTLTLIEQSRRLRDEAEKSVARAARHRNQAGILFAVAFILTITGVFQ